jgi:MFS family permease
LHRVPPLHLPVCAFRGFFTLGRVLASFAALIWSPSTLLFGSLPLSLLGALVALLAPAAVMQQHGWWLLMGVTVLIGLGVSAGFANSLALLDSYCPCTGSITGLLGGVAGAGCMTIPLVVALLAKHTSLQYQGLMWVCLVSFGVQLACVPLVLLVGRRLRKEQAAAAAKDLDLQDDLQDAGAV